MRTQIKDFTGWLNEQYTLLKKNKYTTPESAEVHKLFYSEYLVPILERDLSKTKMQMTYAEYYNKLAEYLKDPNETVAKGAMQFFKSKGYATPDPRIKKYQDDLMALGAQTFTSGDKTVAFNDGVFGIATAKAVIQDMMKEIEAGYKKSPTMTFQQQNDKFQAAIAGKKKEAEIQIPKKKSIAGDTKVETGTQSTK